MFWIRNVEKNIVEHDVVDELRSGKDLPDLAGPAFGIAKDCEVDILVGLYPDNVSFRDLSPDGDRADVCYSENIRC